VLVYAGVYVRPTMVLHGKGTEKDYQNMDSKEKTVEQYETCFAHNH
jgi:hypothetical protein